MNDKHLRELRKIRQVLAYLLFLAVFALSITLFPLSDGVAKNIAGFGLICLLAYAVLHTGG